MEAKRGSIYFKKEEVANSLECHKRSSKTRTEKSPLALAPCSDLGKWVSIEWRVQKLKMNTLKD